MEIFYTPASRIEGRFVRLGPEEAKHAARVLRHKSGEQILVVDGEGNEYRCVIERISRQGLRAEVISQTRRAREPIVEVTLAPAVLKGNKLDQVVEQATELGVAAICPLMTNRTVAALTPARLRRFEHLAIAALKSSTRTMLPRIQPPLDYREFLKESGGYDLKLIAYEDETRNQLGDVISGPVRRLALMVGPEGGLTPDEVAQGLEWGFRTFRMGPRRLRAETACIAALSMVLYQLHEM